MCLGWWRCGRWVARVWAGYGGWELVEFCNGDGTETWKLLYLVIGTGIAQGEAGLSLVVAIIITMIIIRVLMSWPSEVPFLQSPNTL